MIKKALFIIALITCISITAQEETRTYYADKDLAPRERFVDFTHLKLEVEFEPEKKLVRGKVTEKFTVLRKNIDTLFLDAIDMRFFEVKLNGSPIEFEKYKTGITLKFKESLQWGEEHQVEIKYEANPKKGIYFIGWNDETNRSRKQIWTQGQGIDNRHWIPMYDERNDQVQSEMLVYFDSNYQVLSNGVLKSKRMASNKLPQGMRMWHYEISNQHAPYLIMLGIGEYGIKRDTSISGVPLNLYYYPGQEEQVEPTYRFSKEMFQFFENEIGVPYPWKTYSQIPVQDFMYGAMENTTATIFGDFYLVDSSGYLDRNYVRVNAHELAHQWFGDMVTARSSAHHWLQESFATHYDLMYQKEAFGQDHFDWVRRDYNDQAVEESKKNLKPVAHSEGGTVRHYPKGAHVLQMLKYVIGREQFNAGIKYYLEKHAYQNVNSEDLLTAFHEKLGYSLDWFWEEWVYKGDEPHYQVEFSTKKGEGVFDIIQIQEEKALSSTFKMPLVFEIHFEDGTSVKERVMIEDDTAQVRLPLGGKKVKYMLFDPNSEVMKQTTFKKSKAELKAQAVSAEYMLDRYDALLALSELKFSGKDDFFMTRFDKETFHGIKSLIVKTLAGEKSKLKEEIALKALTDKDAEVRKTGLYTVAEVTPAIEMEALKCLSDPSYKVVETALEFLCVTNFSKAEEYLKLAEGKVGNRSHNIEITWLKINAIVMKDKASVEKIVDFASPSFEFLTRGKAFKTLESLQYLDEKTLDYLIEAKFHFNSRLRSSAQSCLVYFSGQEKYKNRISTYLKLRSFTENEKKSLSKFIID